ncbi:MAG: gamma-glutamyl-gamma-aminobutyrate hydrolase family protein [Planctomycetes bacterium]|nr:gamma-glutamyl-gamma-aminobutyrate hydrolase family protein [Planctomycetota bacterium]MBL7008519.1 gamma-glutamyl-gamma-aminobutyrate hydrolase family protein [Planctomycetota bacterium]
MPDLSRADAPLIGVTVELLDAPYYEGRRRLQLFADYLPCLRAAGAVPVLLPTDGPPDEVGRWLDVLDGLLLTGGDDPDLRRLGGPAPDERCKPVPPEQQRANLELVRSACQRRLPMFGVCLGMQMMGLARGAPFCQHLPEAGAHLKGILHPVEAAAGSLLATLVGRAPVEVASFHHQALDGPGDGLRVTASAPDGVVEAVEIPDHPFALGVQWHPERLPDSAATKALFSGFAAAAESYRRDRR